VIFAGAAAFHEGLGWPWWGSFLIVFGILAVIAIILVLVALPLFKKGNPVPRRFAFGRRARSDYS